MIPRCLTCGALVFREQHGRPRQYCSDACRYAAVAARRPPVTKPDACSQCGAPIEQPHTGRPRQYCVPCGECDACGWAYSGSASQGGAARYRCGGRRERDQHGACLCRAPYYAETELDAQVWPWLTGILQEPEQAIKAAQAKAEQQQEQTSRLDDRLFRVATQLTDIRRRIANLDDQLELETDDESRSALRVRKIQRTKERRELEAEHASLTTQQERSPWTCQHVERFVQWCAQLARRTEPETPETKRETYELANLTAPLAVRDGVKLAHVTCMVGEQTLEVGSIANVTSRHFRPPRQLCS